MDIIQRPGRYFSNSLKSIRGKMAVNIFPKNSTMTDSRDQPAVEQDLQAFAFEDDPNLRKEKKALSLEMLKSHVTYQGGSAELAHIPLMKSDGRISCKTIFWWYTMYQIKSNKEKVEYYPFEGMQWENYSINWIKHLKKAIGTNGDISEEGIKKVFNGNIRSIPEEMLKEAETKIRAVCADWKLTYPPEAGYERPSLGIYSVKMARCVCCFNNAERYNEHMKSVHGIDTFLHHRVHLNPPTTLTTRMIKFSLYSRP